MSEDSSQTTLLRLAAFVVDALSFALALVLPATIISYGAAQFGETTRAVSLVWWVALAVLMTAMLLRDGYRGRSPGKRLFGLKVVTPTGSLCSYRRSVARNLSLTLFPIELLLVLFSRGRRRIGDRIANTTIIEE
jgi:uncharacterized RDD family membrane protein YckC